MTLILADDRTGPGAQFVIAEGDHFWSGFGSAVAATTDMAIDLSSPGFHLARIDGAVNGVIGGIRCGDVGQAGGTHMLVSATGRIWANVATFNSYGVFLRGAGSVLENRGAIWADFGVALGATPLAQGGQSTIVNSGTIQGRQAAIFQHLMGEEGLRLVNSGMVLSSQFAVHYRAGSGGDVTVINLGLMQGDLFFGSGSELYDGVHGRLIPSANGFNANAATITSGGGSITLRPGFSHEIFDVTDASVALLDYSKGPAVKMSLDGSLIATSVAAGDQYHGAIRNVDGSQKGDWLRGDAGVQVLEGLNGNDRLDGMGDKDVLVGGRGKDILYGGDGDDILDGGEQSDQLIGGAGDDWFYWRPGDGSDVVKDFGNNAGNNDLMALSVSGFGFSGPLERNPLADEFLITRGHHRAQDREDRLIYDTAASQLWLDPDGIGRRPAVLVAQFQQGVILAVQDIYLSTGYTA